MDLYKDRTLVGYFLTMDNEDHRGKLIGTSHYKIVARASGGYYLCQLLWDFQAGASGPLRCEAEDRNQLIHIDRIVELEGTIKANFDDGQSEVLLWAEASDQK